MPRATRRRASSPQEVPSEPEEELEVAEEELEDEEQEGDDDDDEREADAEDVEEDEEEPQHQQIAQLRFKQPLNWRAGKPIPMADLLRRLQALATELRGYEQDEVDVDSLQTVAKELASAQLLQHKDKGVKALTACCVVDIFRLCAPNAPYTQQQMKEIFTLIVKDIFPALADPSSAYNTQHLHVLKSLAEVKSIILLTDTPGAALLIEHLFKECFDVLGGPSKTNSKEELSKNVEHHMTAVLSTLVDETDVLPNEVTHTVLAQFLRTNPKIAAGGAKGKKNAQLEDMQGTLLLKEAPPAYNMAKNVCNASQDKMARSVTRYWSAIVAESSTSGMNGATASKKKGGRRRVSDNADDTDDEIADMAAQDMEEIRKAHDLLRELWRATPNVLRDIVPLLENELSEENVQKRLMAVETVGDMIAGIGHAGPPVPTQLNPAAYPSQSLIEASERTKVFDFLTTPSSSISFISRYHPIFLAFVNRRHDKSNLVRAGWATAVGHILLTSAGGVGLGTDEAQTLTKAFAECLVDVDEKVRHATVRVLERFEYHDIVEKLGNQGGVDDAGSVLANLADRAKDKKKDVRSDALKLLGRIWGVASGAIIEGSERTAKLLGSIPSKILSAYYINDNEINVLVDRILFDSLLPLTFPPIKSKPPANGGSQRNSRMSQAAEVAEQNPDKIRTERMLSLVNGLDDKAKVVFFAFCRNQVAAKKYMTAFIDSCEKYNGGVIDENEKEVKDRLTKLIEAHVKSLPDSARAKDDLWKFAKAHERRTYTLIRFCLADDSDYKKVKNAYVELTKKLAEISGASPTFLDTITILVLRASVLIYNRSHVQSIIEFSRSDEGGLGKTAHEVLEKISKDKPEVFKAHVQELCKSLESEAPSAKRPNEAGAVQDLKACAQFARQFPADVPKDRKFIQALFGFINHGTPPEAAKYGALIVLLVADKKQMYAKDIFKQCTEGFEYGKGNFLNRLAALGQLMLLGAEYLEDDESDIVVDIAISRVLKNDAATPAPEEGEPDPDWVDKPDIHCAAKIWALKILVNRLRAFPDSSALDEAAKPIFVFLNTLVQKGGQISQQQKSLAAHKSRMLLTAAQLLLKLCCEKHLSHRLATASFNSLALVAMDPRAQVRSGFVGKIMKYLGQNKLSSKFLTPLFLLGHEPEAAIKGSVETWLKSRAVQSARQKDTAMEATFARLLSLLAHHPDWPAETHNAEGEEDTDTDPELVESLKEFMGFILFYLQCVGTKDNLGLVYHVAQRVKGHRDGIALAQDAETQELMNERLYMLSDLAQGLIRRYLDQMGWSLQAWPGRVKLPSGIFAVMTDHETAQRVAMRNYLPAVVEEELDDDVKKALRSGRKRKSAAVTSTTSTDAPPRKKAKPEPVERKIKKVKTAKTAKTPKKARANGALLSSESNVPSSAARKSSRKTAQKSYIEISSEEESSDVDVEAEAEANEGEVDGDEDMDMPDAHADAGGVSEVEEEEEEAGEEGQERTEPPPTRRTTGRSRHRKSPSPSSAEIEVEVEEVVDVDDRDASPEPESPAKATRKSKAALKKAASKPNGKAKSKSKANEKENGLPAAKPPQKERSTRASKRGKPQAQAKRDEFEFEESE